MDILVLELLEAAKNVCFKGVINLDGYGNLEKLDDFIYLMDFIHVTMYNKGLIKVKSLESSKKSFYRGIFYGFGSGETAEVVYEELCKDLGKKYKPDEYWLF